MNLSINSEYAKLVPDISDVDYQILKQSISENGLWIPIIVNPGGVILDGHHRFRACQELKIMAKHATRKFDSPMLEKKFVIEANLKRRQLNDFQKAELAVVLLPIEQELARQRQVEAGKNRGSLASYEAKPKDENNSKSSQNKKSVRIVAAKSGLSGPTFERAKTIIERAPDNVKQLLRDGKSTIGKEYREIVKDEKRQKRHDEIQKTQVNIPDGISLHNMDFNEAPVRPDSVSLILTDPPYHEKYLYLYEQLAKQASIVLREGGSLICYAGHYAIGKIINMMEKHGLRFHWPIAVIHSGPSASVFGRKILVGYKPMLWFTKGKYEGEFVRDVIKSEFQGKELHEWQQSSVESDYYIKYLTIENEIIYDPFLGQGTFGVSAVKLKRQFIGCEIDKDHFETASKIITEASEKSKESKDDY